MPARYNNKNKKSAVAMDASPLTAPMPLLPNQPLYEDRVASASSRQLTDEEKWRQQEEQWARDEQSRYAAIIRSTSDIEMTVPFNSPSGAASNNNSLRNPPNVMADDSAMMDTERFGKLRNYYDRSGPNNTMAADLALLQQQQQFHGQQQPPLFSQEQPQFQQQPLVEQNQQVPLQQLYNQEQHHHEQHQQLHQQSLLDHQKLQQQPLFEQPLSHHQVQPLQDEQQPLLQQQAPTQPLQDFEPIQQHEQPRVLEQPQLQNNFVDPNLNLNANNTHNSYYANMGSTGATSMTSGNASTKSLVQEDGIAPYAKSLRDAEKADGIDDNRPAASATTIVANTISANHDFDEYNIVEHRVIMAAEGERYNAVAEAVGIPTRIDDDGVLLPVVDLASPTAFLDDAQILEEKAKQLQLEKRIADRKKGFEERSRQEDLKAERSKELGLGMASAGVGASASEQKLKQSETYDRIVNEPWDENATGDNVVVMGKPRSSKINADGLSPAAQHAKELKQQQSAGIYDADDKKKDNSPKEVIDAMKAQLNMAPRIKPEDGLPLAAQTYSGQAPKPIDTIRDDMPDVWFEQHRQNTTERRAQKETQRRVELNRKAEEKEGGFASKIAAVFDDTKASIKRAKQEHDLKAEDKKAASHNLRAKERMSKYFPMNTSERFVCAFDAQALHNHLLLAGHLILTDKTLCFVGKGQEDVEVASDAAAKDAHTIKKEHILVKEAIPLSNIASIAMGSVVKNNGKVFILDATDAIVVADALQLFTKDGRIFQFRSFSHPCVTQKGNSYDGRCVPSIQRFLNYLDHMWRAIGGDMKQQQINNIPARE